MADPGQGPVVPGPPLFSDQKNFIETVPPHLFQGLDDRPLPSPLSEGLDLPLKSHARKPLLAGNALPTLSVDKFEIRAQRKITRHEFP